MAARDLVFTILGIDKASKTFNDVGDSIDRMGTRATKVIAGLHGASVVSAAGVAGALAGVPLVFAGISAAALMNNTKVRDSFADLSTTVKTGIAQDAQPLADVWVRSAERIGSAYLELRPQLRDAFLASAPAIDAVTSGVVGLARNAMPGLVTAVKASGPPMAALETVMLATGRASTQFFTNIAEGSESSARGIAVFGDLIEGVLPEVGLMMVDLSEVWAEHGDQAVRVVNRLVDVTEDLGSRALPIVSDAMGVALDVLEGALAVIAPLADQLGPLIGMWLSLSFAMRAMSGAGVAVTNITGVIGKFREGVDQAAGPKGVGKLSVAARGMIGMLGGPWGVALAAAGVALAIFGQKAQDAANTQRALATALRESEGAFTSSAVEILTASEKYKDIADDVERAGLTHRELVEVIAAGGPEFDALKRRLNEQAEAGTQYVAAGQGMVQVQTAEAESASHLVVALDGLRSIVVEAGVDVERTNNAIAGVAASMWGGTAGADALTEAMIVLGSATATTAEHADALNVAWQIMFGTGLSLEQATANFEAGLDDLREQFDAVRGSTANWRAELLNADGTVNVTNESGRKLSATLLKEGEDYRTLAQTAYDTAIQQGHSARDAEAIVSAASAARRGQFIAEMRQMGLTEAQAQALANRYLGLPRDILTVIRADTSQAENAVVAFKKRWDGSTIYLNIKGQQVGMPAFALGGRLTPGEWSLVGERGPELIVSNTADMVLPADQTRQILAAMRSASSVSLTGGLPSSGRSVEIHNHYGGVTVADWREFKREEELALRHALFSAGTV